MHDGQLAIAHHKPGLTIINLLNSAGFVNKMSMIIRYFGTINTKQLIMKKKSE